MDRLRELTKELNFDRLVSREGQPDIPTKDPNVFGLVVGVIRSHKEARVAIVDFPGGSEVELHYHKEKEIFVILSGQMDLVVDGKGVSLKKGDTYYVDEHSSHSATWPVLTRLIAITIPDTEIYND